ncbi:hypothetical protein WN944_003694 [Citrus x changshan-huyou]|uniref:Uncharacterized protein n=1 Tax=Citrus x changshan-huyou TaxID=2935761 RepID=A0AAP0LZQ2_9ROSI
MAKAIRELKSWTEVAPAPIIYPKKPSNSPRLDTIIEESNEEEDAEQMAKETRYLSSLIEVAPALLISPRLETIREEDTEDFDED